MATSPRRAREIARTRLDILEAAARAFARSGYKSTTMQDVAKEAGYTAASLYSYFSSKEEIFLELFKQLESEMNATLDEVYPADLSFRQRLELLMRRQLAIAEKHRAAFTAFDVVGGAPELCRHLGDNLTPPERRAAFLVPFFRAHGTPEDLGGFSPEESALIFSGFTFVFFVRWLRGEGLLMKPDGVTKILDLFFHGLLGPSKT